MSIKNIKFIKIFETVDKNFNRKINGKNEISNISLVKIPKNTILYQGTDFDFDRIKKR